MLSWFRSQTRAYIIDNLGLLSITTLSILLLSDSTEAIPHSLHLEANFWKHNMALYVFERSKAYVFPLIFLMISASSMSRVRILWTLITDPLVKPPSLP